MAFDGLATSGLSEVLGYHEESKHRLDAYAPGPAHIEWDKQPSPFRSFAGAPRIALPLAADEVNVSFDALFRQGAIAPCPASLETLALLLELSLGLSAWKALGPDKWALRCNPSSGNLHPVETYVVAAGIEGLEDGLYHYVPEDHALELRCAGTLSTPGLWLGLTSIQWREAWKYGMRAFRYCALDTGHAIGAIRYAAAALGWSARLIESVSHEGLGALLGTDRNDDYAECEREEPELLLALQPAHKATVPNIPVVTNAVWQGVPSRCDPASPRLWPQIDKISAATRQAKVSRPHEPTPLTALTREAGRKSSDVILNRRSARRFTSRIPIAFDTFVGILDGVMARRGGSTDFCGFAPAGHLVLFVHKVEKLERGLYILPRRDGALKSLRQSFDPSFAWEPVKEAPNHLPFYLLKEGNFRPHARQLCCHQAIAGESGLALAMLFDFAEPVAEDAWRYRQLHWEAGLIGQALYLEAEAAGLGASGIGCFFDDELHQLLGLTSTRFQSLYHFTLGYAAGDNGVADLPAYEGRTRRRDDGPGSNAVLR